MRPTICTAFATGVIGLVATAASADIINIQGSSLHSTEGLGAFAGTIEYNFQSGNYGQLLVDLTNTTSPSIGGFITGFVFNIASPQRSGTDSASLLFSSHPAIVNIAGPGINGMPFGLFDAGAGIGAQFEGGASPRGGIAVGATGSFEFRVSSDHADALSASSFLSGPNEFDFVVRFRGLANDGSDKVPAVPVPGSLALLGAGAMAMGGRRHRPR